MTALKKVANGQELNGNTRQEERVFIAKPQANIDLKATRERIMRRHSKALAYLAK